MQRDAVVPFVFDTLPVRGAFIQLESSWQRMLLGHDYPAPIRDVLGQAAAATALIAQSLKFEGKVTMQLNGDGPLSLLVMQSTHDLELRGMASSEAVNMEASFDTLVVNARCAITVDAGAMEQPYQGIVEVSQHSLAASLENYFARSVQVPSHMHLVSDGVNCGGILLQLMPEKFSMDPDDWHRLGLLAATLRIDDLREGAGAELLGKFFGEDDLRMYETRPVSFRCRCSEQRAAEVLRLLGEQEAMAACTEEGRVVVTCEYCGKQRRFDAVDISRIFADQSFGGSGALH